MNGKLVAIVCLVLLFSVLVWSSVSSDDTSTSSIPYDLFYEYENLEFLGYLAGDYRAVEVNGDYAYAGCGGDFCVIDISDPYQTVQIASIATPPDKINQIAVKDQYVYATWMWDSDEEGGLLVIDISDPTKPDLVGAYKLPFDYDHQTRISDLDIIGYAYVSTEHLWDGIGGVFIIDISDPADPYQAGFIDAIPEWSDESVIETVIQGNQATLLYGTEHVYGHEHGFVIYDISNPLVPVEISRTSQLAMNGRDMAIRKNIAHVPNGAPFKGDTTIGGFDTYDLSDPWNIHPLVEYNQCAIAHEVEIRGNYAYIVGRCGTDDSDETYDLINAFDIYNPGTLTEIAHLSKEATSGFSIDHQDGIMYVTAGGLYTMRYAVSATLDPELGGELIFDDPQGSRFTISVPQTSFQEAIDLYLAPVPAYKTEAGTALVGDVFELTAYQNNQPLLDFPFNEPISTTITYTDTSLGWIGDESKLSLNWWDGDEWVDAGMTCPLPSAITLDTLNNTINQSVCKTGRFGLFGQIGAVFLPVIHK